jgi:hypothetical protein
MVGLAEYSTRFAKTTPKVIAHHGGQAEQAARLVAISITSAGQLRFFAPQPF